MTETVSPNPAHNAPDLAPDIGVCLDCDNEVTDRFCPRCGQETREHRAPFFELLRELFDHLSLDSKLPRSLKALLLQPGRLTEHYLAGRRTSYVKPLRMYLVLSVALFLLFSLQSPDVTNVNVYVGDQLIGEAKDGSTNNLRVISFDEDAGEAGSAFARWASKKFAGQEERFKQMNPQELVDRLYAGFQKNLPRALFIFLPLLALALKVLFLRSGALYFDHLIFALHFQSFLFLLLALCWVFQSGWVYFGAGFLISPIYLLLAMVRTYGGRGRWIIPRWIVLVGAYLFMLLTVSGGVVAYVIATI